MGRLTKILHLNLQRLFRSNNAAQADSLLSASQDNSNNGSTATYNRIYSNFSNRYFGVSFKALPPPSTRGCAVCIPVASPRRLTSRKLSSLSISYCATGFILDQYQDLHLRLLPVLMLSSVAVVSLPQVQEALVDNINFRPITTIQDFSGTIIPFLPIFAEQSFHYEFSGKTMGKLHNKIAVITGGNSGIGFATAKQFIAEGAKVVITGRNDTAIDSAVKELGSNALGIRADAANIRDTEALVDKVQSHYGKVDVLFVNAGVFFAEPVGEITEQKFHQIMDVNFKGAIFTTEKFIPILSEGASVIHLSSVSAFAVGAGTAIYAASKAALNAYSRTAAIELANRKIRVNAITPSMVDTELSAKAGFPDEVIEQMKVFMSNKMPFKRYAKPEEVAKLATFLASDDASFITGAEYTIDGGATVNEPFRA